MSVYDEDGKRLEVRTVTGFDLRVTASPSKCPPGSAAEQRHGGFALSSLSPPRLEG